VNEHDVTAVLERLIEPLEDEVGSWDDVIARAAEPRSEDWDDVLDRAASAQHRRLILKHSLARHSRRRLLVLATTALVVIVVTASGFATARSLFFGSAGRIVFECDGQVHFPQPRLPRGHCTVSGVITDRGKFADDAPLGVNPHVRTFFGTKGTIEMNVYLERGHWEISTGSGAYRGLRGGGQQSPTSRCHSGPPNCFFFFTMRGTVSG
jgi:hypothetical protein